MVMVRFSNLASLGALELSYFECTDSSTNETL